MKRLVCVFLLALPASVAAQRDVTQQGSAGSDSAVYARARQLVLTGSGPAGRALVDSMVDATTGRPSQADALYWRASLSATASDAERDYRRLIVEYASHPRAADALLGLAQLEMTRGDREGAVEHLQRFLLENPSHPERGRGGVWLARLLIEQGKLPRGCMVLTRARATLPAEAIELRNQLDYYGQRCVGVDTTEPPRPVASAAPPRVPASRPAPQRAETTNVRRTDTTPAPPPAPAPVRRDTVARADTAARQAPGVVPSRPAPAPVVSPPATSTTTARRFTVQVAAFDSRPEADQLAARLRQRGLDARVWGVQRPFRVRIGRYAAQSEATNLLKTLRTQGMNGFVTVAEPTPR